MHLTLEHAFRLCRFFKFSDLETEFFLELVSLCKTTFGPLRAQIEKRLQHLKKASEDRLNQFRAPELSSLEHQFTYYSSWTTTAVHILLTIPQFKTRAAIARKLGITEEQVQEDLEKLVRVGLLKSASPQIKLKADTFILLNTQLSVQRITKTGAI